MVKRIHRAWRRALQTVGLRPDSEDRFRILFEYSRDAHLIFDSDGIFDCNEAAVEILALLDKGYLIRDTFDYTFGVDHRFLAVNVTPAEDS